MLDGVIVALQGERRDFARPVAFFTAALQDSLCKDGGTVSIHQGNVGDPKDCRRVIDEVLAAEGRIDVLVNNAGVTVDKTVRKMSVEELFVPNIDTGLADYLRATGEH